MTVLAIDPGLNGAWATLDSDGKLLSAGDLPTVGDGSQRRINGPSFASLLHMWRPETVIIEDIVGIRPGQAASTSFRYGRAVGYLEGIVLGCGFSLERVTPQKWMAWAGLRGKKGDGEPSRQRATERFPAKSAEFFSRKKDHHRSEAALIGLWFIRNSERIAA
jgi:crossover junction endodeoxyribonuclease RuvC